MPELNYRQGYFFSVYQDLAPSRDVAMHGALPIKVSEILAYCELFKVSSLQERSQIFRFVTALDGTYMEHVEKKRVEAERK